MNRRRINQITGLLLLLGLGGALAIYLTADHTPVSSLLNDPLNARRLHRQLRVMGGQANVLAADFENWFAGLWQGESLAGTVAVLTIGITLAFRFAALHPGSATSPKAEESPPSGQP